MDNVTEKYQQLIQGGKNYAHELFQRGSKPDWTVVRNQEYDGCNLFLASRLIGIRKFRKGFWEDPDGNGWGYNLPVRQDAVTAEWSPKKDGTAGHFGFYSVTDAPGPTDDIKNALLLDYKAGRNSFWGFTWVLRDYLRHPWAEHPELLLGAAYIEIGPVRFFSNYFALRKAGPSPRSGYLTSS